MQGRVVDCERQIKRNLWKEERDQRGRDSESIRGDKKQREERKLRKLTVRL